MSAARASCTASRVGGLPANSSSFASAGGTWLPITPTRKPLRASSCRSSAGKCCSSTSSHSLPFSSASPSGKRTKTTSIATLSGDICAGGSDGLGRMAGFTQPHTASPTAKTNGIRPGSEGISAWKAGKDGENVV